jgi:hypothetical protein
LRKFSEAHAVDEVPLKAPTMAVRAYVKPENLFDYPDRKTPPIDSAKNLWNTMK